MSKPIPVIITHRVPDEGDGAGAQVQRVMATFSIAKAMGLGYLHTPINSIGANPLDSSHTGDEREAFLQKLNELVRLPSDDSFPVQLSLCWTRLTLLRLVALKLSAPLLRIARRSLLIQLHQPYPAIDKFPRAYENTASIVRSRLRTTASSVNTFVVDVHIRRSVIPSTSASGAHYERFVPLDFYETVLNVVDEAVSKAGLRLSVNVHTDAPDSATKWTPLDSTPKASIEHWRELGMLSDDGSITLQTLDTSLFSKKYGDVKILRSIDPIAVWNSMVQADLLVTGASSLSYVGGILRGHDAVISPRFWHGVPESWLVLDKWFARSSNHKAERRIKGYLEAALLRKFESNESWRSQD